MTFDVLSAWFASVLAPVLLWQYFGIEEGLSPTTIISIAVATASVYLSVWFIRNFAQYPGISGGGRVIASSLSAFAIMSVGLLLTRSGYSIKILTTSFIVNTVWLAVVTIYHERRIAIRIGIVPVGRVNRLHSIVGIEWIVLSLDTKVVSLSAITADLHSDISDEWERAITDYALEGIPVYHYKQLTESLTGRVELDHIYENSFGSLIPSIGYLKLKRILDWMVAFVGIIILLPLFLIVVAIIRLESPGPSIFRQQRIGYRGNPFTIYKFRTMRVAPSNEDAITASMTKLIDDRITRVGAFLRRSRVDELPQLLNILKGEMSLIGPRPEAYALSELYEENLPFYRYRHIVYPGITGWAQISQGHVTSVSDVRVKLDYDFYYVKNVSFWLDIVIVLKTVITMLSGRGAL